MQKQSNSTFGKFLLTHSAKYLSRIGGVFMQPANK